MLICYLDDSGKNPQSAITTLAGFVADQKQWTLFESDGPAGERSLPHREDREDRPEQMEGAGVH